MCISPAVRALARRATGLLEEVVLRHPLPFRLPIGAAVLLRRNLLIYGLGGLVVPFVGIKLIDMLLVALHLS